MAGLNKEHCVPCRVGAPLLPDADIARLNQEIPDWRVIEAEGIKRLDRVFKFSDFAQALAFVNKVAQAAEEEGHHPALLLEWGQVTVTWWTHKIRGLHQNDFVMAAKTDGLYRG
ncbi:MAG: 4a-hydroxytetrahydrobiopterin dehydratase [Elusimicrobia bacterium]|nr:4a-hydroxytetrahydrobiopterin dehydratase [Elusimicrobiota bacterium]